MRAVLLDNRDSFVWNLAQALGVLGCELTVLRSDLVTPADVAAAAPDLLVLSPGPGRPEDAGCCVAAIHHFAGRTPILGVCLGHQAIGHAFGARIERSAPCHGKSWSVHHDGEPPFDGLPNPLQAARYHSLCVARAGLPDALRPLAWTPEGTLMAMRHTDHPILGLQFHPESFRSPHGPAVLARSLEMLMPETAK